MTILDTIFSQYFTVVPLATLASILGAVVLEELIYTIVAHFDVVS